MQKVYTNQNIALVGAARSYLEQNDIVSQMRNEFSSSVMGEVAFFDVWPELWVADEEAERASKLLTDLQTVNTDDHNGCVLIVEKATQARSPAAGNVVIQTRLA